jgi:hypothetical protein
MRVGIKDVLALSATDPTLRDLQLVGNDFKKRLAGRALGDQAHGLPL